MKTTYNWLREFCDIRLPPAELAHRLSMSGCLIEEVTPSGDDFVLVAEVTSNRPDQLGTVGIAREVCALTGVALRMPDSDYVEAAETAASAASVEVLDADLCPRYTARVLRGVKVGPSPDWLRRRIEAIGLRPVNNVVDVTNYVLFECGQPLHAFDLDKLRGRRIVVRRAGEGERMIAIDGTECKLNRSMLVIADADRSVAVAGVMGGLESEISPSTRDILLESACFENTNIRRTSRALGLSSDSSYRFERGVDPVQVDWASRRAAHLIQKAAGGTICRGVVDVWAAPYQPKTISLRMSRMRALLSVAVPAATAREILQRLGFAPVASDDPDEIRCLVPPFRAADVYREIDLIEEVIRIHGYDRIPEAGTLKIAVGRESAFETVSDAARGLLPGLGYFEVVTSSFCDEASDRLVSPWSGADSFAVQNTIRRDENLLRRSLLPGLLAVKRTNVAHGTPLSPLFEISRVFLRKPPRATGAPLRDDILPEERHVLGILDEEDLLRLKGAIERLSERLGLAQPPRFEPVAIPFFQPGRAARILLADAQLGVMGEVERTVAERYDLPRAPFVAELDFDLIVGHANLDHAYARPPAFPSAARDLAVVLDELTPWAAVEGSIRSLGIPILERIEFFDVFRGKQIPKGKKSIAFSLTFRAADRTLTSEEVEAARQSCIRALAAIGAELRQ